jgi:hypothetical protein
MPRAEWAAVLDRIGCPFVDAAGIRQTMGYAVLLSPIAGRFDWEGARWLIRPGAPSPLSSSARRPLAQRVAASPWGEHESESQE